MSAGDLIAQDGQIEYDGLLLGDDTSYIITRAEGLDMPALRVSDITRPHDHGLIAGNDYLGGRTIDFELVVIGDDTDSLAALLDVLAAVNPPGEPEAPLVFREPGRSTLRRVLCRLRRRSQPITSDMGDYATNVVLRFEAIDPRIYDNTETTINLTLPAVSGGLGWPVSWPLGWGTATSGFVDATNSGTFPTRPVVTFSGPLTSPSIENVTTGESWSTTFDLQSGDTLVVDFDARTVLLNGTASRYSYTASDSVWWDLEPGINQLRLGASAGNGTATVAFRSAWI